MSLKDSFGDLIDYSKLERTYEVMGKKVVMKSITAGQMRDAMNSISTSGPLAQLNGLKICLLARSVVSIDGKPFEDSITEKEKFWGDVQISTLQAFFDKYNKLRDEQEKLTKEASEAKNLRTSSPKKKNETGGE